MPIGVVPAVVQVQPLGIHQSSSMAHVVTQRNGKGLNGRAVVLRADPSNSTSHWIPVYLRLEVVLFVQLLHR